jgi:hypothetical protein
MVNIYSIWEIEGVILLLLATGDIDPSVANSIC